MLGPDNYWDLRYYHLYAPWAYLHGRYLYDIGPAQEQGFLNPTADFLLYGLISSPLNDWPRLVAFIMGAVHGINAALLLVIVCRVIRPPDAVERATLRAAAWLMGVTGAGFVGLLGTSTNDLTSSLFVLGSLASLIAVGAGPSGRASWRGFAAAGLWAGLGLGLKYTVAFVVPGLGVVAVLAALAKRTLIGLIVFGLAAGLGFLVFAGHHLLTLWNAFGNPFFPYLNQIFRSPYFEPTKIWDPRFIPDSFWKLMTFPFYWTRTASYVVSEPAFRDWRAAIAYVAIVIGVLALAAHFWRGRRVRDVLGETPGLPLVLAFVVVSYFSWALQFGYYRYAIPLEMPTGVIAMGTVIWLFRERRLRLGAAVAVAGARAHHHRLSRLGPAALYRQICRGQRAGLAARRHRADRHLGSGRLFHPLRRAAGAISRHREQLSGAVPDQQARHRGQAPDAHARPAEIRGQRRRLRRRQAQRAVGQFRSQAERGAVPAGAFEPGGSGDQPLRGGVR